MLLGIAIILHLLVGILYVTENSGNNKTCLEIMLKTSEISKWLLLERVNDIGV